MTADLIFELLELTLSLAHPELDGGDVEHILLEIVQTGAQAYEDETGEKLNPDLIAAEAPT